MARNRFERRLLQVWADRPKLAGLRAASFSRRWPTSAGTAARSCSSRSATRRRAERQSRWRVGERLLLWATRSDTSASVTRDGSGKGLIRAEDERGAFILSFSFFGRVRERLGRPREDRRGQGVTFG